MWEWLRNMFNRHSDWDPAQLGTPWSGRTSIHAWLAPKLDPATGILRPGNDTLPDEDEIESPSGVRYAPGAFDGLMTRFNTSEPSHVPETVARLIFESTTSPSPATFRLLHAMIVEQPTLSFIDQLDDALDAHQATPRANAAALGRYLASQAADRAPVKVGLFLIGRYGDHSDSDLLLTLGTHDEFTLFSLVALMRTNENWCAAAIDMARRVTGWGRIHCIERLDLDLHSDAEWLLREGYKNDILPEYTAAICARRGKLFERISSADVDDQLITAAATILAALCRGGPGEGMGGYDNGAPACTRLIHLVTHHQRPQIQWLLDCHAITTFIEHDRDWTEYPGWNEPARKQIASAWEALLHRPLWASIIHQGLAESDDLPFRIAAEAAPLVHIDAWPARFERLRAGRDEWYWLLETPDWERAAQVLDYARRTVPIDQVATGPGQELGFGPGFEHHRTMDWIVQALARWPGEGWTFLAAALRSPVTRNRALATKALELWPVTLRSEQVLSLVQTAADAEPDERTRLHMQRVLDGLGPDPDLDIISIH